MAEKFAHDALPQANKPLHLVGVVVSESVQAAAREALSGVDKRRKLE